MITYNHERYIQQAIESVIHQRTSFPIELVIGEDCSTDSTGVIAEAHAQQHGSLIRLCRNTENVGAHKNYFQTLDRCRGEFVAWLDGDDYWTSPDKLQKQVDLMRSRSDVALCFHQVKIQERTGETKEVFPQLNREFLELKDLAQKNCIAACSVMYRRAFLQDRPDWLLSVLSLDVAMSVLAARYGKVAFIREAMGVYRRHGGGIWSGASKQSQIEATVDVYKKLDTYLQGLCRNEFRHAIYDTLASRAISLYEAGDFASGSEYARRALVSDGALRREWAKSVGLLTRLASPRFHNLLSSAFGRRHSPHLRSSV
jgi:glycosyltransferase involved in cell wall biosynthesis